MAILCLKQARLFNWPGTNDAAGKLLGRCVNAWQKSCQLCSTKINIKAWGFPLSQAEVKMKKEEGKK